MFKYILLATVVVGIFMYTSHTTTPQKTVSFPTLTPTVNTTKDTSGLSSCLDTANSTYEESWQQNCQANLNACIGNGVSEAQCTNWYGGMCKLGNTIASQLSNNLQRDKIDCFREY